MELSFLSDTKILLNTAERYSPKLGKWHCNVTIAAAFFCMQALSYAKRRGSYIQD